MTSLTRKAIFAEQKPVNATELGKMSEGNPAPVLSFYKLSRVERHMQRTQVDSSAVASAGYEPQWRLLEIEFTSKGIYDYFDVPFEVYLGMVNSDSIGEFVNQNIKPFYRFKKVD